MRALITELIPHAPQMRLYVAPNIPADRLTNALEDYGEGVDGEAVIALFDATLMGSAKDGVLFMNDHFVFQNSPAEPRHTVRYDELVSVAPKRKLLGRARVAIEVNRARATMPLEINLDVKPDAMPYIARFLDEAMVRSAAREMEARIDPHTKTEAGSDVALVQQVLSDLVVDGALAEADHDHLLKVLREL